MASAMPCLFDDKAGFPLPALFARSCCFHHSLSTTSSATRATKSLQSLLILALKRLASAVQLRPWPPHSKAVAQFKRFPVARR